MIMTYLKSKFWLIFVPAVAVIRKEQALIGIIRCKESVGFNWSIFNKPKFVFGKKNKPINWIFERIWEHFEQQ